MKIKFFNYNAREPKKGDEQSAGYDLYSSESCVIPPWSRKLVSTGIGLEIPIGNYGRIASRSSLGVKGFDIGAGVIDSSYRGEIKVVLINSTNENFEVQIGDRIAQIIFEQCLNNFVFENVEHLSGSGRGDSGFGSTGR